MNKKGNDQPRGMAWYNFLIYFGLFAGALFNFITGMIFITGDIYEVQSYGEITAEQIYRVYGDGLKTIDIFYGLCVISISVLMLVLRHKLKHFIQDAFNWVIIVYASIVGAYILHLLATCTACSVAPIPDDVTTILIQLIVLILNAVYFKKRAHLFVNQSAYSPRVENYGERELTTNTQPQAQPQLHPQTNIPKGSKPSVSTPNYEPSNSFVTVNKSSPSITRKQCKSCGAVILANIRFCPKCGKRIETIETASNSSPLTTRAVPLLRPDTIITLASAKKTEVKCELQKDDDAKQIKFCRFCGVPVAPNSRFCHSCGKKLVLDENNP